MLFRSQAKEYLLKALAIDPNLISVLMDLGIVYELQNEQEKAAEVYQKVVPTANRNWSAFCCRRV